MLDIRSFGCHWDHSARPTRLGSDKPVETMRHAARKARSLPTRPPDPLIRCPYSRDLSRRKFSFLYYLANYRLVYACMNQLTPLESVAAFSGRGDRRWKPSERSGWMVLSHGLGANI